MKFLTISLLLFSLSCATNGSEPKALKIEKPEVLVCKGSSSYAYHDHHCQGLNKCRGQIVKLSIEEAKKLGRIPCGYCYKSTQSSSSLKATSYQSSDQCNAITKKKTRCSRKARSGGYCWQHGG